MQIDPSDIIVWLILPRMPLGKILEEDNLSAINIFICLLWCCSNGVLTYQRNNSRIGWSGGTLEWKTSCSLDNVVDRLAGNLSATSEMARAVSKIYSWYLGAFYYEQHVSLFQNECQNNRSRLYGFLVGCKRFFQNHQISLSNVSSVLYLWKVSNVWSCSPCKKLKWYFPTTKTLFMDRWMYCCWLLC